MKVLFVCNQNQCRSPTAEELFKSRFITKSAGLYGGRIVAKKDLSWADTVAVMESEQRVELVKRFPSECLQKKLVCLNIPDIYNYNDPELIELLKRKEEEL
ncbi:MAG: phosphotyrosine protein phosphatase [Candidatus Woesearchaeota archaeon]|nr:phosphotyrosine protein phosphatase [Candidatus Woesearchaeota archaeon]